MAPKMPRAQSIVLPILRAALGPGVKVGTWVEDIDYRTFPMVNVRRVGGTRLKNGPNLLALPVIELSCYGSEGLAETEVLYDECLDALYAAAKAQTPTDSGYIHSVRETMGMTQFSSLFQDSWRVQGLIAVGIRPPRNP